MTAPTPSARGRIYLSFPPDYRGVLRDVSRKLSDHFFLYRLSEPGLAMDEMIQLCDLFVGVYDHGFHSYQLEEYSLATARQMPRLLLVSSMAEQFRTGELAQLLSLIETERAGAGGKLLKFTDAEQLPQIISDEVHLFFENGGAFEVMKDKSRRGAGGGNRAGGVARASREQLESELTFERARVEKAEHDLMSSTNAKAYEAAVSELNVAKKRVSELETKILEQSEADGRAAFAALGRQETAGREGEGEGGPPIDDQAAPAYDPLTLRVLESAARLGRGLGLDEVDCPTLLTSLFLDREDETAFAFLFAFGHTRDSLLKRLGEDAARGRRPVEVNFVPRRSAGGDLRLTHHADDIMTAAEQAARGQSPPEVLPRDIFGALIRGVRKGDRVESLLGEDALGWIRETLDAWGRRPVKLEDVQARLVEDDFFSNPETHRDSAAEKDLLGFEEHAEALVKIIRKTETRPPLVIGVYGPWGSGKSTFMGLVKRKLDEHNRAGAAAARGFFARRWERLRHSVKKGEQTLRLTTVTYDAWAYVDAPKLWAGLVGKIARELDAELTLRDRLVFLLKNHSRRLLAAAALGLVPVALFAFGYAARRVPGWAADSGLLGTQQQPWNSTLGWGATAAWAAYAYFVQKRPVTQAVSALAARFDTTPAAGVISRIQDEFKTALRTRIEGEQKAEAGAGRWPGIRERVRKNELKIVVFIDELDRCPLERIVEILEAIKLFLAEDIFIVLLGVDTRVAAEAIRLHYKDVHNPDLPREYLEKIVQLPLRVPSAGRDKLEAYLKGFMFVPEDEREAGPGEGAQAGREKTRRGAARPNSPRPDVEAGGGAAGPSLPGTTPADQSGEPPGGVAGRPPRGEEARGPDLPADGRPTNRGAALPPMPDTRAEFAALSSIAEDFLDGNPRRIKRLLNTYRYVKILAAHLPGIQVHAAGWQETMLYWLAFTMRWPAFMEEAVAAAFAEVAKPEAKRLKGKFLLRQLRQGDDDERPTAALVKHRLPLDAAGVVRHYELAPNFLIESPSAAGRATPVETATSAAEAARPRKKPDNLTGTGAV